MRRLMLEVFGRGLLVGIGLDLNEREIGGRGVNK